MSNTPDFDDVSLSIDNRDGCLNIPLQVPGCTDNRLVYTCFGITACAGYPGGKHHKVIVAGHAGEPLSNFRY
jgi:hypothetical protein